MIKIRVKFELDHPLRKRQMQVKWGGLKSATFDEKCATTRKRYKIDV